MKRWLLGAALLMALGFVGCNQTTSENIRIESQESEDIAMRVTIDHQAVDVTWEKNASVNALREYAKDTLTVETSRYGGFEQVGSLGRALPSSDTRITTKPGDICLYSSNQVVVFFGSNTWLALARSSSLSFVTADGDISYFLAISVTVRFSCKASKATFALNSGVSFFL